MALNPFFVKMKHPLFYLLFSLITMAACGRSADQRQLPRISKKDSLKIQQYIQKSIFYQQGKPDSALHYAREGLQLSQKLHYRLGEALLINQLSAINEVYGNLELASRYQKEVLVIYKQLKNRSGQAAAHAQLGMLEAGRGRTKLGMKQLGQALALYKTLADIPGMVAVYTRLGEVNELDHQLKQAMAFYIKAKQLNKDQPVKDDYFVLLNNMARLNVKKGLPREALRYYREGIEKSSSPAAVKTHIRFLHSAGHMLDTLDSAKEALVYHRMGLQNARAHNLKEDEARSLLVMARAVKDEDAQKGIQHLKTALDLAQEIGHKQLSAEIYKGLTELYNQQSMHKEALNALEMHHRLNDSLSNINKAHKLLVLQNSYELAARRAHIESLELSNQEKTYQRNIGIGLAIAAFVILAITAFYFYKTRMLNKRLIESNRIKDQLFSIIGHDLRNPVGGITQLLAVMDEQELSLEELHQMISAMRKQGDVALEILNALLNWGEAQLKGVNVKTSHFSPLTYIQKNLAALNKQVTDKSLRIENTVAAELWISGDADHFDFIIRNLLSNAIKFSYPGKTIWINADVSDPEKVIFSVKDEGKGITETQQALFLKQNLDITYGTSGEKGTGIGLMLCLEFIKANHGKLWLISTPGNGTTFFFYF